jgi:haloalkane dehalogenase
LRIDFTPSPTLYPFESHWFESSIGRVHYIDEGKGSPIVFFHGNPTWSFVYRNIVAGLRGRLRCVAVDYPGFGLSDRPDGYGYTPQEHAAVVGELLDHLELDGFVSVGHDWGGPISMAVVSSRPDRVRGVVLGNTWFWPIERLATKVFSRVMSTRWMQRRILERNYFVERLMPLAMATNLSAEEMDHYRRVQPTPEARVGVAEFPRQLLAAGPWLEELDRKVRSSLGSKPALLVWGMKDFGIPPRAHIPHIRSTFADSVLVELPRAKHFIQEDAPDEIARAIVERFVR